MKKTLRLLAMTALTAFPAVAAANPALAIIGGTSAESYSYMASLKTDTNNDGVFEHDCGAVLVAPDWVVTAAHCVKTSPSFVLKPEQVRLVIGDKDNTAGEYRNVSKIVPHSGFSGSGNSQYDIAMLELSSPSSKSPISVAPFSPGEGWSVRLLGWGATCADVQQCMKSVRYLRELDTLVTLDGNCGAGNFSEDAELCILADRSAMPYYADSGGPALFWVNGAWTLAGLTSRISSNVIDSDVIYTDATAFGQWMRYTMQESDIEPPVPAPDPTGTASVYGILADGRLTYYTIDVATGNRTHTMFSDPAKGQPSLSFTSKAMATLNINTLLVTSTAGELYRIDIQTFNYELKWNPPVLLGTGWTHDLLTYDGAGKLYGIAGGTLRRYSVTASKPTINQITSNTLIGSGFTLKTLTSTTPGWIMGTTSTGLLLSYRINGASSWNRYELKTSTWGGMTSLLSPGKGVFYGRTADNGLYRYFDHDPTDGSGNDLKGYATDPVDTRGWTHVLLSAYPNAI